MKKSLFFLVFMMFLVAPVFAKTATKPLTEHLVLPARDMSSIPEKETKKIKSSSPLLVNQFEPVNSVNPGQFKKTASHANAAKVKVILEEEAPPILLPVQLKEPYLVEVAVENHGDLEQKRAFTAGLRLILIELSKNDDPEDDLEIMENEDVKNSLSKARNYVLQFIPDDEIIDGKKFLFFRIKFDKKAISKLLERVRSKEKASKVIWINDKPTALLWLAEDVGKGRIITDKNSGDGIVRVLKNEPRKYGIKTIFPFLDLEELKLVKARDICAFNEEVIKKASARYGVDVITMGCVKPDMMKRIWYGRWLLLQNKKKKYFDFMGSSTENVIAQALQIIAGSITEMPISVDVSNSLIDQGKNQAAELTLRIITENGLEKYEKLEKYLLASKNITQVDLGAITDKDIKLNVVATGGHKVLLSVLDRHSKLVPHLGANASPPGIDLDYEWIDD